MNVFDFCEVIMAILSKIIAINPLATLSIVIDDDQEYAFDYYKFLSMLKDHKETAIFDAVRDRVHGICFL